MQTLDVISVNIWQILISLANLTILFLLFKKFLFKPVKKVMEKREAEINSHYDVAQKAEQSALDNEKAWNEKIGTAQDEANSILKTATDNARFREEKIIENARDEAQSIINQAKQEAILERKKATDGIKHEIVEVSGALTEKLLGREINTEDHRALINSFISEIDNGGDVNE